MLMSKIRNSTIFVAVVFGLGMVGWFLMDFEVDAMGAAGAPGDLGRVNGERVDYNHYMSVYQELTEQARQQAGARLSAEQMQQVEDMAWERVVNEMLLAQEIRRHGLQATDSEVRQAAMMYPHPELAQNELFRTDGEFDIQKYQQFLSGPTASGQLLLELERYYREMIPRNKLMRRIASGVYPTDAELWREWRDRNETATVDYVMLDVSRLAPQEVEVTSGEIRRYYRERREDFQRPEQARVDIAFFPKRVTAADSTAALEHARSVRERIVTGEEEFAEVARMESVDPGSRQRGGELGAFPRGAMVGPFDEAAFSLPIGEVSEPVLTQFGYHIIEVTERDEELAHARHILIPIEPTERSLDQMYARADSLEMLALQRESLADAAAAVRGDHREDVTISSVTPHVPGIGSTFEGLQWARDVTEDDTGEEISPLFETEEAFYVVRLHSYTPSGRLTLEQATPQIRQILQLEKQREAVREIGREMVTAIRGGATLEDVAAERDLQVRTAEGVTRIGPGRVFGQANAVVGAAFGTPIGQVSNVVESEAGIFLLRPTERTEADREAWTAQLDQQRMMRSQQRQQEAISRWLDNLVDEADIVDNRAEVLQRQV